MYHIRSSGGASKAKLCDKISEDFYGKIYENDVICK